MHLTLGRFILMRVINSLSIVVSAIAIYLIKQQIEKKENLKYGKRK